ncbi:hypothetical protein HZF24_07005 [Sedimentibacter hydroxybenzoicus DSM 7310]|uniref:Uncharacterized protein n=1 Tax=Sedimentibacter hydroxybenzoicus DSM 7310 TaxID=1123245 RepID=A0A974BIS9_SEDHY|nr:hypothetical protein [Sedimentibacter hydroxybenzoicus]NYB73887.1 hypothetical protein [Sedimentibacter hydroxybenzoicus DSM 7310]
MNIEEFTNIASELKVSVMKADKLGIYSYGEYSGFHVTRETFINILGDRKYTISKSSDEEYPYKYSVVIAGMTFYCIAQTLLFEGDENKIEEEI